jgi:hypothetical protein
MILKTQLGTTKGEMPPGFSIISNLMMYKIARWEKAPNSENYFEVAFNQMGWMILVKKVAWKYWLGPF